jgi:hypothetical protein
MTVDFPFARGVWSRFQDFSEFEESLLAARRDDPNLDHDLRNNGRPWIKIRNEELYPAWYFIRNLGLSPSTEFRIGQPGAAADIEIRAADQPTRRLQITTAGPLWRAETGDWGADHVLHMQQLNQLGQSSGWGPYQKEPDGSITNRNEAISSDERDPPYAASLRQALEKKQLNQHGDCELIVALTIIAQRSIARRLRQWRARRSAR